MTYEVAVQHDEDGVNSFTDETFPYRCGRGSTLAPEQTSPGGRSLEISRELIQVRCRRRRELLLEVGRQGEGRG
jgi:hypothetical protein